MRSDSERVNYYLCHLPDEKRRESQIEAWNLRDEIAGVRKGKKSKRVSGWERRGGFRTALIGAISWG